MPQSDKIAMRLRAMQKECRTVKMGKTLKLCEELFTVEKDRMDGGQSHFASEIALMICDAIKETAG